MKIISWNLNHRILEKPIPVEVIHFFKAYSPDLIMLNEYVDAVSRDIFKSDLKDIGYHSISVSPKIARQNQILLASKHEVIAGDILPPGLKNESRTNFIHGKIPRLGIEVVGYRSPWYEKGSERRDYRNQLINIINQERHRNIIFIGDLNFDPFKNAEIHNLYTDLGLNETVKIPNPIGDWSYVNSSGTKKSRIDHAFVGAGLNVTEALYLTEYKGIQLAGTKDTNPVSDHVVLSVELEVVFQ